MSIELLGEVLRHPTEDLLEEYGFRRVREPALARLEEHLLVCATCQSRLEELDEYAALMKSALAGFEQSHKAHAADPRSWLTQFTRHWFTLPGLPQAGAILAGVLLLAVAGAAISWRAKPVLETATVQLIAFRGGESGFSSAPSGRPLDLTVDGASLPAAPGYTLELVSQTGRTIWTGEARFAGAKLSAHVGSGPGPGVYWVRLYSSQKVLLREYGMRLQ